MLRISFTMSVDKFGRYTHTSSGSEVVRGPKGEGFLLTADGDYDIQSKRLKFVQSPTDETDAVNLKSLREHSISLNDNKIYDAGHKRITNVDLPQIGSDCVSKTYLYSKTPHKSDKQKSYTVHQYNIKDVGYPSADGDAVNLSFVKGNCLLWDNQRVDVKGAILSRVRDPITGSDCATKTYVDSVAPFSTSTHWVFNNKRLTSVAGPVELNDAVTKRYMQDNSLCKLSNSLRQFDGQGNIIANIAEPVQLDDAVSKRYLKQVLADLGYAVYSKIHKGRAALTPPDQWKAKVLGSTTTWDDLFK